MRASRWVGLLLAALVVAAGGLWLAGDAAGPSGVPNAVDGVPGGAEVPPAEDGARLPGAVAPAAPVRIDVVEAPGAAEPGAERNTALSVTPRPGADGALLHRAVYTGRVVDAAGGAVAGAYVVLVPDARTLQVMGLTESLGVMLVDVDRSALPAATTGSDGRFRIEAVAASDAVAYDYVSRGRHTDLLVYAPGMAVTAHRCARRALPEYEAGDIAVVAPGAGLRARAVDERGRPVAGLACRLEDLEPEEALADRAGHTHRYAELLSGRTGEDGVVVFEGLWPGTCSLEIRADRYQPVLHPGIPLPGGIVSDIGDVVMALGGVIEGRVEDTEGRPVPFADVYPVAVDADDWDLPELTAGGAPDLLPRRVAKRRDLRGRAVPQAPARTTGEGLFVKAGLEPGVYALVADAVGFEPLLTTGVTTGQSEVRLTLQRESLIVLSAVDRATGRSVPIDEARAFRCSGRDDPWRPGRPESTQVPVLLGAEDGIGGMLGVLWKDWRSV